MVAKANYYLLSVSTNWADEMDIEGHLAMTEKQYKEWKKRIDKIKFPVNVSVGTNEDVDIHKDDIEIKEITEQDYKTLKKLGLTDIGHTNCIDLDYFGEPEEDDEED